MAGLSYAVRSRDALKTGVWQKLYDIPADPVTRRVTIQDSSALSGLRFYRVIAESAIEFTTAETGWQARFWGFCPSVHDAYFSTRKR